MFIYSDSSSGNIYFFWQIVCIVESYKINADVEKISLKNPRSLSTKCVQSYSTFLGFHGTGCYLIPLLFYLIIFFVHSDINYF